MSLAAVEAGFSLHGFSDAVAAANGRALADLAPLDEIEVVTRNTRYHITVLVPVDGRILVQGGAFFPVAAEARLAGASLGGSLLKLGWIGCGFCLEVLHEGRRIVTTRVREIRERPADVRG